MTIINLRTADGFTLHDNYYAIPETMDEGVAGAIVEYHASRSATWEDLNARLYDEHIQPATIPTIDIEF